MGVLTGILKEPQQVEVKGRQLVCSVCDNDRFHKGRAQLNTSVLTFLKLDWLNKSATCFTCSNCTHIIWFGATKDSFTF